MREEDTSGTGMAAEEDGKAPAEASRGEGLDMGESDKDKIGIEEYNNQF